MAEQALPVASHDLLVLATEGASSQQGIVNSFLDLKKKPHAAVASIKSDEPIK